LGRKNAFFAGLNEGAENWAGMPSLIEPCKMNGVNPQTYFTDDTPHQRLATETHRC
jgi:transposase